MSDQSEVRTRTRPIQSTSGRVPQGAQNSAGPPQPGARADWMYTGDEAARHRAREAQRQQERRERGLTPFRFYVPVGKRADIIILDNSLGPCMYEHRLPGPGGDQKKPVFETCPKDFDVCPLCSSQGESYYVMFLSVIDMTPFTRQDGTVVQFSRKLLPVKTQQQPFFMRLAERHGGNLRGVHLLMCRDNRNEAAIGTPEETAAHTEDELVASFSHPEVRTQDGQRVLKRANEDLEPFDYARVFPKPSAEDLRRRYGGVAPAGSREDLDAAWGGQDPGQADPAPRGGGGIQRTADTAGQGATAPAPAEGQGGGIQRAGGGDAPAPAGGADDDDEIPF